MCCVDVENLGSPMSEGEWLSSERGFDMEQQETFTKAIKPHKPRLRVKERVRGKETARKQ